MWISEKRFNRLVDRIESIEQDVKLYVHNQDGEGGYVGRMNYMPVNKALRLLLDHLGMRLIRKPSVEELIVISNEKQKK